MAYPTKCRGMRYLNVLLQTFFQPNMKSTQRFLTFDRCCEWALKIHGRSNNFSQTDSVYRKLFSYFYIRKRHWADDFLIWFRSFESKNIIKSQNFWYLMFRCLIVDIEVRQHFQKKKNFTSRLFKGKLYSINFVCCICDTSVLTCLSKCIKCYEVHVLDGAIKEFWSFEATLIANLTIK